MAHSGQPMKTPVKKHAKNALFSKKTGFQKNRSCGAIISRCQVCARGLKIDMQTQLREICRFVKFQLLATNIDAEMAKSR